MGYTRRGRRDGTGPYRGSYQRRIGGGRRGGCYKRKKKRRRR